MLGWLSLVVANLAITRWKEQQRGQQVIVKLVIVKLNVLDKVAICLIRLYEFSVKNVVAFHASGN